MTAGRPRSLVLVAGTGTEVGKTFVGAQLLGRVSASGWAVAARKPAQSFAAGEDQARMTDAHVLAAATGERPDQVCIGDRWYPVAMAPPMAAEALGRPPVHLADLVAELTWPPGIDVGLVETAGGVRSPLAVDGDAVALVRALAPDVVVLVADAGLGTINVVRLAVEALTPALGPARLIVFLNRFQDDEELHRRNRDWLVERCGLTCVTEITDLAAAVVPTSIGENHSRDPTL